MVGNQITWHSSVIFHVVWEVHIRNIPDLFYCCTAYAWVFRGCNLVCEYPIISNDVLSSYIHPCIGYHTSTPSYRCFVVLIQAQRGTFLSCLSWPNQQIRDQNVQPFLTQPSQCRTVPLACSRVWLGRIVSSSSAWTPRRSWWTCRIFSEEASVI